MTMIESKSVRCGHCGKSSKHMVLMSTNEFGSPDLDLRPPEMQRSTMDTWLKLCPACGYCAPNLSQPPADPAVIQSKAYRDALGATDFPELARRFPSVRRGHRAVGPRHDGSSLLASRVGVRRRRTPEQAAESRRQSAAWFQRCKPFSGDEEGASMGAVLVDVLRRCGEFGEASAECQATMASPGARASSDKCWSISSSSSTVGTPGARTLRVRVGEYRTNRCACPGGQGRLPCVVVLLAR